MYATKIIMAVWANIVLTIYGEYKDYSDINFEELQLKAEKDNGSYRILDLQVMLNTHNEIRRRVAKGLVPGYPKAAGMPIFQWDDRLAYESMIWVNYLADTVLYRHPNRTQVEPWSDCGQNLGYNYGAAKGQVEAFEAEKHLYDFKTRHCKGSGGLYTCSHTLQLYHDGTTHVGCQGRPRPKEDPTRILFICDYSSKYIEGEGPYKEGTPCSACPASHPFCQDDLCVTKEICDKIGHDKCWCPKKDSQCKNGSSVDLLTCQCTKNCPDDWMSPFCDSKCTNGEDMDDETCEMIYPTDKDCKEAGKSCAKYCKTCAISKGLPIPGGVSNVFHLEPLPDKDCINFPGAQICYSQQKTPCSKSGGLGLCPRKCNSCAILKGRPRDWVPDCHYSNSSCENRLSKALCQVKCKTRV